MAAKKTTAARSTRSKADTRAAFDQIRTDVASSEGLDRVSGEVLKATREKVEAATKGLTVDTVVQRVTQTQLEIQRTLSGLAEQLTAKTKELEDLNAAVEFAKADLETFHNLDVAATSIEHLISDYQDKEAELQAQVAAHEAELLERKLAWQKEEAEYQANLKKARDRERADYEYNTKMSQRKSEDMFAEAMANKRKELAAEEARFRADWSAREEALQKAEKELADLRAQVAAFPEVIKKETEAKVAIATNSLKKDLTHDFALKSKELETQVTISNQRFQQAEGEKRALSVQVEQLQKQLDAARDKIIEVANKAVDGAGANLALMKVQETINASSNGAGNRNKQ